MNEPLYRLPAVLKAETIYIVEGEQDVHTIEGWGLTATTNPEGAGKWNDDRAQHLADKWVVIVRDNDAPGRENGERIVASIDGIARGRKILDLPEPGPGEDISMLSATVVARCA